MVTIDSPTGWLPIAAAAQEAAKPALEQLEPPQRAVVVLAIFALVLTGLALVAGAMIGAHWVRRMARHRPRGASPTPLFQAKTNPQPTNLPATTTASPDIGTGSTIQIDAASSETKHD